MSLADVPLSGAPARRALDDVLAGTNGLLRRLEELGDELNRAQTAVSDPEIWLLMRRNVDMAVINLKALKGRAELNGAQS